VEDLFKDLERIDPKREVWLATGNPHDRLPRSSWANLEIIRNCREIPSFGKRSRRSDEEGEEDEEEEDEDNNILLIVTSATNLMEPLMINALSRVANCILIGDLKSRIQKEDLAIQINFNQNDKVKAGFQNLSFFRRMWAERPDLCYDRSK
jgi:hypothetical protein